MNLPWSIILKLRYFVVRTNSFSKLLLRQGNRVLLNYDFLVSIRKQVNLRFLLSNDFKYPPKSPKIFTFYECSSIKNVFFMKTD